MTTTTDHDDYCRCLCHQPPVTPGAAPVRHFSPCCRRCPHCGHGVILSRFLIHEAKCLVDSEQAKWEGEGGRPRPEPEPTEEII
jgi:uncharacterized protein (DUF983 family)